MSAKIPRARTEVIESIKKPMATARRASLFSKEVRIQLSSTAAEMLVEHAQVLSEGQVSDQHFFGSTMLSLDLRRLEAAVSDEVNTETAARFGRLAANDAHLQAKTRALAVAEAQRLAGRRVTDPQLFVSVRADGPHLQVDVDIEAQLEAVSKSRTVPKHQHRRAKRSDVKRLRAAPPTTSNQVLRKAR